MADYGIWVVNDNNETIIDSRDGYANMYIDSKGSAYSAGSTYPPTTLAAGDLVVAHPLELTTYDNDGNLGRQEQTNGIFGTVADGASSGGLRWAVLKTSIGLSPAPGEYGLEVYDASGNVIFQSIVNQVQVLYAGRLTAALSAQFSCAGYDMNNIYAVMNNTVQKLTNPGTSPPDDPIYRNMNYFFSDGGKYVIVECRLGDNYFADGMDYMIVHLIAETAT